MTMRDYQWSFTDSSAGSTVSLASVTTGTYLAPNSLDTAPLGAYLTELTAADTQLSANVNTYRELGGGDRMWLVIDFTTAVTSSGSATIDFQLVTASNSALTTSLTVVYDFTALAYTTFTKGYRLIAALPRTTTWLEWIGLQYLVGTATTTAGAFVSWIGWDVDAVDLGGASGFSIK